MIQTLDEMRDAAEAEVKALGAALRAFPRLGAGMTPDAVKFSPEYRQLKYASDAAFARLRAINTRRAVIAKRRAALATAEQKA